MRSCGSARRARRLSPARISRSTAGTPRVEHSTMIALIVVLIALIVFITWDVDQRDRE
jgi:hypothetical protein